jgi:N-acetylglutamate synthase-like GNAT family acetyltransferase
MREIILKEYTPEYQDAIIDLILSIQRDEFKIPITKEDQPDLSNIPNFYQTGKGNFWIALCGNQVVGTISLIDIGNRQGALRKMFVKADYRGSSYNVSKMLLQKLIIWAREYNYSEIYLGTTEKFLAAHRFYEKNNFIQIAKDTLPAPFPIMKVDTRFYQFKL